VGKVNLKLKYYTLCRAKIDEKQLKTNRDHKNQEQQTNFVTDSHTFYAVKLILLALLLALLSMLIKNMRLPACDAALCSEFVVEPCAVAVWFLTTAHKNRGCGFNFLNF
jgi:uncharacterized membrane protein